MMPDAQKIIATVLGCGSSGGVPRIGNVWGDCDPAEPRNRRRRCALLIEGWTEGSAEPTRILIDTGCDLREQLLDAKVDRVDAVLYTHEHADHTHGIDDLRVLALNSHHRVNVYFSRETGDRLRDAFGYCFAAPAGSDYPPILDAHEIEAGAALSIDGPGGSIRVDVFSQVHGNIESLGYRVGNLAYSCDLSAVPAGSHAAVSGLTVWIIDALRPAPHPSHLSLAEALGLVERFAPAQAVLTNMHIDMDYRTLKSTLPGSIEPGFDGMRIDVLAGTILNL